LVGGVITRIHTSSLLPENPSGFSDIILNGDQRARWLNKNNFKLSSKNYQKKEYFFSYNIENKGFSYG
jgi:hypothetical protein